MAARRSLHRPVHRYDAVIFLNFFFLCSACNCNVDNINTLAVKVGKVRLLKSYYQSIGHEVEAALLNQILKVWRYVHHFLNLRLLTLRSWFDMKLSPRTSTKTLHFWSYIYLLVYYVSNCNCLFPHTTSHQYTHIQACVHTTYIRACIDTHIHT